MVISALQHWEEVVCFDNESSLFPHIHPSNSSSGMANSDGSNALTTSQKMTMCDYQPLSASPDNMPSIYSIGGLSGLDPYDLHSIDSMDVRFEQPLRLGGQDTNSFIYDTDAVTQPFCGDEPLPYFDSDYSLHSSSFEQSDSYLQSAVNSFLGRTAVVTPDKAQRRWKMLFSVLRWFSVRRIVARKGSVNRKDKAPYY